MIGPRIGIRAGLRIGPAVGLGADRLGVASSMAGVTQDATSLIYCPSTASEWTTTLLAAGIALGGPSFLYLCQEASGNLADTIGGVTLTVGGAPLYRQAVTGWTRLAVQTGDGTSQNWTSTSASLPDISTTSFLAIYYLSLLSAPSATHILGAMGTTAARAEVTTTSKPLTTSVANTATGTGTLSGVVPYVLAVNRTASTVKGYTLADKMAPAFNGTMTGKKFAMSADNAASACAAKFLYCANLVGSAAELSDAQVKTLLQTLNWQGILW